MSLKETREFFPTSGQPAAGVALHPWRDLIGVALLTLATAALAARFDASEALLGWLRRRETLQVDELPGVLLVLCLGLLWFAARRYQDVRRALLAHQHTEQRLALQLERNRTLHLQLLEVQERERRTLARELHDELGQYLGTLRFDLHALADATIADPAAARAALLERARTTLNHLQGTVRTLIGQLRPPALDTLGLEAALEQLVHGWQLRLPDTRLELHCTTVPEGLAELHAITLFRLTQEALTNLARHARASQARLQVHCVDGQRLVWSVEDDGVGFDPAGVHSGLGLVSMSERVEAVGGRFTCQTRPGQGCLLRADWSL